MHKRQRPAWHPAAWTAGVDLVAAVPHVGLEWRQRQDGAVDVVIQRLLVDGVAVRAHVALDVGDAQLHEAHVGRVLGPVNYLVPVGTQRSTHLLQPGTERMPLMRGTH